MTTLLTCIGVLAHPKRPETAPLAEQITQKLQQRGLQAWCYATWDETSIVEAVKQANMVIAIGGDGAMLKAARVCAPYQIPVLGVNMGRLGFLTEIADPQDYDAQLDRVLAHDYWVEHRMMLTAQVQREHEIVLQGDALNDAVISGDRFGRMIQLDTYIDGLWATTYNSDALIIATPTGSTAYALAVGGPILPPELENILIIPAAPHLSMDRPIVLSEGSQVAVRPAVGNRNPVALTLDGVFLMTLTPADTIQIRASQHISRFVRLRPAGYFYRSLLDRLEPRVNRAAPE
jgi:NAD+ kinase